MSEEDGVEDKNIGIIIAGRNTSNEMTDYKRSAHNDFATGKELRDRDFSGVRHNSISGNRELWVAGDLAASMSEAFIETFPDAWNTLYADTFGLIEVEVVK